MTHQPKDKSGVSVSRRVDSTIVIIVPDVDYVGGVDAWITEKAACALYTRLGAVLGKQPDAGLCRECEQYWGES